MGLNNKGQTTLDYTQLLGRAIIAATIIMSFLVFAFGPPGPDYNTGAEQYLDSNHPRTFPGLKLTSEVSYSSIIVATDKNSLVAFLSDYCEPFDRCGDSALTLHVSPSPTCGEAEFDIVFKDIYDLPSKSFCLNEDCCIIKYTKQGGNQ